jgi:hypothetical protein
MERNLIETFVRLLVERQVKQAHLSGGRTSEWGSDDHVSDLEARCADAAYWRDKYPKGSERRSHYRNVYSHLRRELQSAKKTNQLNEKQKIEEQ